MKDMSVPCVGKLYRLHRKCEDYFRLYQFLSHKKSAKPGDVVLVLDVSQESKETLLVVTLGSDGVLKTSSVVGLAQSETGWDYWWEEVTNETG